MRVMGIDPGFGRMGVAVLELVSGREPRLLFSTCLETYKSSSFASRLGDLMKNVRELTNKWTPDSVALEKLYFNKNVKTAMQVAEVRGALIGLLQELGKEVREYSPQAVKFAVTGSGNASKNSVIVMISKLIKLQKEIKHDDEYDAIAIAITDIHSLRI
ncbi:MAG: crossover junction endodeoxyribonuclease RuvC [Patescibacteria group bacterium]